MSAVVKVENITKRYRLGTLGSGTLAEDFQNWFNRSVLRRPLVQIGPTQLSQGHIEGNTLWALRDVSFEINEGEVVGVLGRNGAGKSTLMKIMSQITAPTSGRIRYKGRMASLLEVGTGFNGELTGRENIFLNGSILGMTPKEIRRRFDEIVDFAEIDEFIDTPVKRYSSGMFVRLAFAVAAHLEADIMIVDEVLAVGDVEFQKKCIGKMSRASHAGRTILFVSHRMDHITALCSRCIVLAKGALVFDGTTDDAIGRYYQLCRSSSGGETNLETRTDRLGHGRVRFRDIWVENARGERVEILITGQPATFKLRLEGSAVKDLNATIVINTLANVYVGSFSTLEAGISSFTSNDGTTIISLKTEKLPLNFGQFYVNASVRSVLGDHEFEDLLENAMTFSVDRGDFHGMGETSGGLVSFPQSASVSSAERKLIADSGLAV